MAQDSIKRLAAKVKSHTPIPRKGKSNRTIAVTEPQYSKFQKYCASKGITASEVIDNLIEIFLNEVKDDLNDQEDIAV